MTEKKKITNREYRAEPNFVKACEASKLKPTKRQASKFRRGEGVAFGKFKYVIKGE